MKAWWFCSVVEISHHPHEKNFGGGACSKHARSSCLRPIHNECYFWKSMPPLMQIARILLMLVAIAETGEPA